MRNLSARLSQLFRLIEHRRTFTTTRQSRLLAERLYRTFETDFKVPTRGVQFYVHDGTVTVYGTLETVSDRDRLVAALREVPGVKAVIPHLQIVALHLDVPSSV